MDLFRYSSSILLCLALAGCFSTNQGKAPIFSKGRDSVEKAALNWDVEYYSQKDLALQEIMKTPTTFPILFEEDSYVWERALIFLKNYTNGVGWNEEVNGIFILTSDSENNDEKFHYQISKKMTPDGYVYSVHCYTWEHLETPTSLLNAKNLSRFMRRGELERELITS